MPVRRHRKSKKSVIRRRRAAKRTTPSKKSDVCRIHEVQEFNDVQANKTQGLNFALYQFPRASQLAPNFKWYRAVKVEWMIDPNFNIYGEGSVGGTPNGSTTVPYLYHRMNRNQDAWNYNVRDLQAMGAKPVKFTKQLKYTYKPNWNSPGLLTFAGNAATDTTPASIQSIQQQGLTPQYGWLMSTDAVPFNFNGNFNNKSVSQVQGWKPNVPPPATIGMVNVATNTVLYNGSDIFIDQYENQINTIIARVTCKVTWEFKDPNFPHSDTTSVNENGSAPVGADAATGDLSGATVSPGT